MGQRYRNRNKNFNADSETKIQNEKVKESIKEDKGFKVRVEIKNLNIRKGPGMEYRKTGKFTGIGEFTIVEKQPGSGSPEGWGRLETGGWISLHFCEVLK